MAEKDINFEAWREAVSARKDCLTPDVLEKLAESSSDSKAAQHLAECPHCQAELAMLKSFESSVPSESEGAAVAWIAAQLERGQNRTSSPAAAPIPFWRNFLRVPYLAGALAALLILGLGISMYVSDREPRSLNVNIGTGTMRSGNVRLAGPSGNLDQAPDAFRWEAYPEAKSYLVQVTEVDGTVLWSKVTSENFATPTPELKSKMHPGKTLQWKVTALDTAGKPMATSSQEKFQIKLPNAG